MSGNVFDDGPYRITKTRLHNQSIGGLVEQEAPLEKKTQSQILHFQKGRKRDRPKVRILHYLRDTSEPKA
jgi:hypothetical protein